MEAGRGPLVDVLNDGVAVPFAVGQRQQHVKHDWSEGKQVFSGSAGDGHM
jgi:hypothetical protein